MEEDNFDDVEFLDQFESLASTERRSLASTKWSIMKARRNIWRCTAYLLHPISIIRVTFLTIVIDEDCHKESQTGSSSWQQQRWHHRKIPPLHRPLCRRRLGVQLHLH
ncbi:hypothetical protein BS78_08G137600 [Paspalum vaginatum]|nr:hypothetical protein BS78_08G137600 [Paspalum vaginatum]